MKSSCKSSIKYANFIFYLTKRVYCGRIISGESSLFTFEEECMGLLESVYKSVDAYKIEQDMAFMSFDHRDKDIVLKFIKLFRQHNIRFWSMYDAEGNEMSTCGDHYRNQIVEALRRTCMCLVFISKNALISKGVDEELRSIANLNSKKIIPTSIVRIYLDGLDFTDLNDKWRDLIGDQDNSVISESYSESDGDKKIQKIFDQVYDKYLSLLVESMQKYHEMLRDSKKIVDLMNECISYKCPMRSVSEDIKSGGEVSDNPTLREVHVLSDEIDSYDYHPYSCVVISTNLLGNVVKKNGKRTYCPNLNGVKYFYYLAREKVQLYKSLRSQIKGFIRKTRESRHEVVRLIRREYCLHNRLILYFKEFNGLTQEAFISKYRINSPEDRRAVLDLFNEDFVSICFQYTNKNEELFHVPGEFISWLRGKQRRYSVSEAEVAYNFIDFLNKLLAILNRMTNSNAEFVAELTTKVNSLNRLRDLERWQEGTIDMSLPKASKLITFLLNGTAGNSNGGGDEKFPKLASWLMFERDQDGNVIELDKEIVDSALSNLQLIELDESKPVDLCSSFVLFIGENNDNSAGWYTTGESDRDGYVTNFVIAYDLLEPKKEFAKFAGVFKFLIELNPDSMNQLQDTRLMAYIKGETYAK